MADGTVRPREPQPWMSRPPSSVGPGEDADEVTRYGTATPCSTTGPKTGSSSALCDTPGGLTVAIASGTEPGEGADRRVPPTGQTPKVYSPGRSGERDGLVAWNPFCPVTEGEVQPGPGFRTGLRQCDRDGLGHGRGDHRGRGADLAAGRVTQTGEAKPWTSRRWLQASAGAIV